MTFESMTSNSQTLSAHEPIRRNLRRSLTGIQLISTGGFAPEQQVTNADLHALGYDSDWIIQRTGIKSRRRASADMATSDMAYEAARRCIANSSTSVDEIDLIVVATMTPDVPMPSTACLLQEQLGVPTAGAMDVNAACAGFMYALITAAQFVATGTSHRALVVGADTNTRIINPKDKQTYPLFGDGAGAVLLGPGSKKQGFLAYSLGAEGSGAGLLEIPGGGSRCPLTPQGLADGKQYMRMDGRSVFKWAVRLLAEDIRDVVRTAGLGLDDIKLFVLHQANLRIIEAASEAMNIPREKMLVNLDRFGNTSAGSIPLGLDEACRAGEISRGDAIVLCGFGAGLVWGTAVVQW